MILHSISLGLTYAFILNLFYNKSLKFHKDDILLSLSFMCIVFIGVSIEGLPNFIVFTFEPMACILLTTIIKRKPLYESIIGYFTIFITIACVDISFGLIASLLGILESLIQYSYHIGTVIYPFGILIAFIFKSTYHARYLMMRDSSTLRKRKFVIAIMISFMLLISMMYHYNHQTILTGSYSKVYQNAYLAMMLFYIAVIYLISFHYLRLNQRHNKAQYQHKINIFEQDLLAKSYALQHDTKNIIQSLSNLDDTDSILDELIKSKIHTANQFNIQIEYEYNERMVILDEFDLSIVCGILLDNAIDHLSRFKQLVPIIHLKIVKDSLQISNALFNDASYDEIKYFEYGYTSKSKKSSGFGLYNAQLIAEKYNCSLNMHCDDQIKFILKKNKPIS